MRTVKWWKHGTDFRLCHVLILFDSYFLEILASFKPSSGFTNAAKISHPDPTSGHSAFPIRHSPRLVLLPVLFIYNFFWAALQSPQRLVLVAPRCRNAQGWWGESSRWIAGKGWIVRYLWLKLSVKRWDHNDHTIYLWLFHIPSSG